MIRKAVVLLFATALGQDDLHKAIEAHATHLKTVQQALLEAQAATAEAENYFKENSLPDENLEAEAAKKNTKHKIALIRMKSIEAARDKAQSELSQNPILKAKAELQKQELALKKVQKEAEQAKIAATNAIAESEEGFPDEQLEADSASKAAKVKITAALVKMARENLMELNKSDNEGESLSIKAKEELKGW